VFYVAVFCSTLIWIARFAEGMNMAYQECLKSWQVDVSHRETNVCMTVLYSASEI